MKTLVFWCRGPLALAQRRHGEGARILALDDDAAAALSGAGVPHVLLELDPDQADTVDEAAIAWTKQFGRRPILDGRSLRDLLTWRGVSLWWFAELYLHHSTQATRCVRWIERFARLLERERPDEVEAVGLPVEEALLLARCCTAQGALYHGPQRVPGLAYRLRTLAISLRSRWNGLKTTSSALKATLAGVAPRPEPSQRATVLFLSHAAFWRERRDPRTDEIREYEHYFDRMIPAVEADPALRPFLVAVGPRAAFRRRSALDRLREWLRAPRDAGHYVPINAYTSWRVRRETARATSQVREAWRRLRRSPGVHEAFSHRGVGFADLAGPDLAGSLLLQLPWAVRSWEEMAEVLAVVQPRAVCLYAESSGWGRAALAACRAAGVPSLAVQHGILYPKYYSYRHDPDETGCPLPERTALFGESARRILVGLGRYPAGSLSLTGSPKFDDLLTASRNRDRAALREAMGVGAEERLLVVASRYHGIRETHQSIGSAFAGLVRAVESLPGLHCLVKPHPAERAEGYQADIRAAGATRVRLLPGRADLTDLLLAADVLVTVESLSAVEALVLGRPVLILNMPTNLRELVESGAAVGLTVGEDPAPALRALLFDAATRERLAEARSRYLSDVACGVDGHATERILALIRETARAGDVVAS